MSAKVIGALTVCLVVALIALMVALWSPKVVQDADLAQASSTAQWFVRECDGAMVGALSPQCYWVNLLDGDVTYQIPVAVFRRQPSASAVPLVYLAGGPGQGGNASGDMLAYWQQWYRQSDLTQDFIVLDLPLLAPGSPQLDCTQYNVQSKLLLRENLSFAEEELKLGTALRHCLSEAAIALRETALTEPTLRHINTLTNVDSMSRVLTQLGYEQWDYFAVSYGTRVALLAASVQPNVRRMVLDSPYLFSRGLDSDIARLWQRAFAQFWSSCGELYGCEQSGITEARFWRLMAQLKDNPIRVVSEDWTSGDKETWLLNDGRLAAALFGVFYTSGDWTGVVPLLVELERLESQSIELEPRPKITESLLLERFYNQLFDPSFNSLVYFATECNDNRLEGKAAFERSLKDAGPWAQYFADVNYDSVCLSKLFLTGQLPSMETIAVPTLVLSGTLDPITPIEDAHLLMSWLPLGVLWENQGGSHGEAYVTECGRAKIRAFLAADGQALTKPEIRSTLGGC